VSNQEPKPRPRTRRVLGLAIPAVLLLGTVSGALVYTKKAVDEADRTVPTVLWAKEQPKPGKDPVGDAPVRGRSSTPMSRLLLPVPEGYRLGPDIGEHGNDTEVGERAATRLLKETGRGLAGKERRDFERRIDGLGVRGFAMRSYLSDSDALVAEVQIVRMRDVRQLRAMHELRVQIFKWMDAPQGPRIKGHKEAVCHMLRAGAEGGKDEGLEGMTCLAYRGDAHVSVVATGTAPFERAEVAQFVKDQLDHIASPGEYV
jgi:hypothetical protein